MHLKSPSSILNYEDLSEDNNEPNSHEHGICKDTIEDVNLIIDLSGTEHVEDLEKHEKVEYNGQVSRWSESLEVPVDILAIESLNHAADDILSIPFLNLWVWMRLNKGIIESDEFCCPFLVSELLNEEWSRKNESEKDNRLEDRHTQDVLHHLLRDDVLTFPIWWSLQEIILWKLSGES